MKIYIAGPMTGLPDFNYPAFHEVAARLREQGHEVMNPAENPQPSCASWAGYMRLALAQLVQCDCIVLLPGWADSKGALFERKTAQVLGMQLVHMADYEQLAQQQKALAAIGLVQAETDWSAA